MPKEWKCLCGEWVEDRYPAHSHAEAETYYDPITGKWEKTIGKPPLIWTCEREPDRPTRDSGQPTG